MLRCITNFGNGALVGDEPPMTPRHSIGYDIIFFIALLATALALGAALAHVLELPNKILAMSALIMAALGRAHPPT